MDRFQRRLTIELPQRQSAFLWGARQTGKSTFVKDRFPHSLFIDLLGAELFLELSKKPSHLRQLLAATEEIGRAHV